MSGMLPYDCHLFSSPWGESQDRLSGKVYRPPGKPYPCLKSSGGKPGPSSWTSCHGGVAGVPEEIEKRLVEPVLWQPTVKLIRDLGHKPAVFEDLVAHELDERVECSW